MKSFYDIISKGFKISRPYGRKKLAIVVVFILIQGLFQVISVASIFPFLKFATDLDGVRSSSLGASILNVLPEMSDRGLLITTGLFAILMLCLSSCIQLFGEIVTARYSHGLGHWLRCHLLSRIATNPYSYFLQQNTGELLKKCVVDVNQTINLVFVSAITLFSRLITVLLLIIVLIATDPTIAFSVTLSLVLFYMGFFAFFSGSVKEISGRMKIANRGAMREAQQLLGGIKPIKIHLSESNFLGRYVYHSAIQASLRKVMPLYKSIPRYLIEPISFSCIIAVVTFYGARGDDLTGLIPKLGVIALAGYKIMPSLHVVYSLYTTILLNRHCLEEVHDVITASGGISKSDKCLLLQKPQSLVWSRSLRIENLNFSYPDTTPVFADLSLEIHKNEFIAIVGPTGSGKSTFVDLLLGLHNLQSGRIVVDDISLTAETVPAWRASIGYVPQEIFLLDDTIAGNIAFGVSEEEMDLGRVANVSRIAQIAGFIETELAEGYHTKVGERGVRLSGGQRQRIGLARALYHGPTTLVLDEATSALDDETEKNLIEALESLHGNTTLIVIAHRLSTIRRADRIFAVNNGKMLLQDSPEKLSST